MEEALKYSRLLFHLLIVTCAAITGLALSPDKTAPFDALKSALSGVQTIIEPPGGQQAIDAYKDQVIERHTAFTTTLRKTLGDLHIGMSPNIHASDLLPIDDSSLLVRRSESPTVGQVGRLVTTPGEVKVFKPDDLHSEITAWLHPFRDVNARLESIRLGGIEGAGRYNLEAYFEVSIPSASFAAQEKRIVAEASKLSIEPRFVTSVNPVRVSVDLRIHGDYIKVTEKPILLALASKGSGAMGPSDETLLKLREFDGLSMDAAIREVEKRRTDSIEKEKLVLFGIEFNPERALVIGPLALLVLLIALFVHGRHLIRMREAYRDEFKAFPWVMLFNDRVSKTLTVLACALWPFIAVVALALRGWRWHRSEALIAGSVGCVIAGVSILLLRKVPLMRPISKSNDNTEVASLAAQTAAGDEEPIPISHEQFGVE